VKSWKHTSLLVGALGFSNLGNWIYFVAINIAVLDMTGSAAAVAGLFVIRPIALLVTNFWSGSVVDRTDVKKLMVLVDLARGGLMVLIPFASSLWAIYGLIFLISLIGSFFGPSQSVYITKLIPVNDRQRFNSILSMSSSGAFLVGPALSGVLILHFGMDFSIFFNAATFFVCALIITLLPSVKRNDAEDRKPFTLGTLVGDWRTVRQFAVSSRSFMIVYALFQGAVLIGSSIDSQEATFIRLHLNLSVSDYGAIISMTGVGSLAGAFVATLMAKRISYYWYLSLATLFTSVFYMLFYASNTFAAAAAAFVLLGFFMSFTGAGYATYFQQQVPAAIMGRVTSLADATQGSVQIALTLLVGFLADRLGLQGICLAFSGAAVLISVLLCARVLLPLKNSMEKVHNRKENAG
jgi:MFS family permease